MDSSIIAAFSAILGTTVRGLTTFATTFLNQRYAMRRDILAKDVANREQLYSEFIKEVGNLYFDSVNRTLDDTSQQASLITMYSLVGRIRMFSSEAVLTSAEKVAEDIIESYKRPPMSFQEFQQSWRPPIRGTSLRKHVEQSGKACLDAYSSSRSKPKKHWEMLDWLGGQFDPAHFDPREINAKLRGLGNLARPSPFSTY
jgi:hypothetical protein